MSISTLLFTVIVYGILCAEADFIQPPPFAKNSYQDNPRYVLGSPVNFSWKSDVSSTLELLLFIDYPRLPSNPDRPDSYYLQKDINKDIMTFNWTATLMGRQGLVPAGKDAVCFLALAYQDALTVKYYSSYFNISVPDNLRSSSPSPTVSPAAGPPVAMPTALFTPGSTYILPSVIMPTSTIARETSQTSDSDAATSGATIAGISVGAGIGAIFIIAFLVVFWRRWYRGRLVQPEQRPPRRPHVMTQYPRIPIPPPAPWRRETGPFDLESKYGGILASSRPGTSELDAREIYELP